MTNSKATKKLKPNKQILPKTNNPTLLKILNKIICFYIIVNARKKSSMTKSNRKAGGWN